MRSNIRFTSVIVYGDSLSDTGNFHAATGQPTLPYYGGRFSNGLLAVEHLAAALGLPLVNHAWGGATSGIGNHLDGGTVTEANRLPGMRAVFDATRESLSLRGALVTICGGTNDFLSPSRIDALPTQVLIRAVGNLMYIINEIRMQGACQILVPAVPDISLTPYLSAQGGARVLQARNMTDRLNKMLLDQLATLGSIITFVDTAKILRAVVNNPETYDLANVTGAYIESSAQGNNANEYLFWDDYHPTDAANTILARHFLSALLQHALQCEVEDLR
jgi:cholinesterase